MRDSKWNTFPDKEGTFSSASNLITFRYCCFVVVFFVFLFFFFGGNARTRKFLMFGIYFVFMSCCLCHSLTLCGMNKHLINLKFSVRPISLFFIIFQLLFFQRWNVAFIKIRMAECEFTKTKASRLIERRKKLIYSKKKYIESQLFDIDCVPEDLVLVLSSRQAAEENARKGITKRINLNVWSGAEMFMHYFLK